MSGAVNPDHFVVDAATGAIVERRLGDKRLAIRSLPGGGTEHVEPPTAPTSACLTDDAAAGAGRARPPGRGALRLPAGHRVGDRRRRQRSGSPRPGPITTLYPLPSPRRPATAGLLLLQRGPGADPADHADGPGRVPADRLVGRRDVRPAPVAPTRSRARRVFVEAGQRVFFDVTAGRAQPRRAAASCRRVLGVMEARTGGGAARRCSTTPGFALDRRSPVPVAAPVGRVARPLPGPAAAVARAGPPDGAARRASTGSARGVRRRADAARPTPPPTERLDLVERRAAPTTFPVMPTVVRRRRAPGSRCSASAGRLLALADADPASCRPCCAACRTTSPPRWTWRCGSWPSAIRADPASAAALRARAGRARARRTAPARCRRSLQDGLAGFLAAYGHRAVAEIDLGMPRWSDDPAPHARRARQLPAAGRPGAGPGRPVRRGAPRRRGDDRDARRARAGAAALRAAAGAAAPLRPRPAAGRAARVAQVPADVALLAAAARRAAAASAPSWPPPAASTTADDVFFLDLRRGPARRSPARTCAPSWPRRREEYDAGAAPPAHPAGAAVRRHRARGPGAAPTAAEGALVGTPGLGRHASPASARVVLDPVGAHLEPGEILVAPVDRPGLDAAVPDRRRAGDGDGRRELARRRRGPRVRHPGGRRRAGRHRRIRPATGSRSTAPPARWWSCVEVTPNEDRCRRHAVRSPVEATSPRTGQLGQRLSSRSTQPGVADTVRRWFSRVQSLR